MKLNNPNYKHVCRIIVFTFFVFLQNGYSQQSSEDIIKLLTKKQVITEREADSLRKEKVQQKQFFPITDRYFTISGYTQIRYQNFQMQGQPDGMDIRRAKLDFTSPLTEKFNYRLLLDFAGTPKIMDAYCGYTLNDHWKFTCGQFIIPLSFENNLADRKLEMIDRSQVVEAFCARSNDVIGNQNGRDIGIQLSGQFVKINSRYLLDYFVGGFNGAGINAMDNNNAKDLAARIVIHPLQGWSFGGSYYDGYDKWIGNTTNQVRYRYGLETTFSWKNFLLRGEYIAGQDGTLMDQNKNMYGLKRNGYYLLAGWYVFPKKLQVLFRYDFFDPNNHILNSANIYYVPGVNYFFNDWVKIQMNYSYRQEQDNNKEVNNDIFSMQIQMQF